METGHIGGDARIYTAALCEDLQNSPPALVFPKDGDVFNTPREFTERFNPVNFEPWIQEYGFNWGDMSGDVWSEKCTYWEAQVSTDSTFATGVMPIETAYPVFDNGGVINGVVEWCHTYYWRVREYLPDIVGPWSAVSSFRIVPPDGWDHCLLSAGVIEAIATTNATCRLGPGTVYGISSYVPAGESHPVEGRNAAGTWLKLQDLGCYIYRELLALEVGGTPFPGGADVSDLMSVLPDPPLPTETPLPVCKSSMGPDDLRQIWRRMETNRSPAGPRLASARRMKRLCRVVFDYTSGGANAPPLIRPQCLARPRAGAPPPACHNSARVFVPDARRIPARIAAGWRRHGSNVRFRL